MAKYSLVSVYTKKIYKNHKLSCNENKIPNIVNREFDNRRPLEVLTSDLTYVRVNNEWHYICTILDLFNREIVGYAAGKHKDAKLVMAALRKINANLYKVNIFHSDRGKEFDNMSINELLNVFGIKRSLSAKGCPYDNAVSEATYSIIKIEFANKIFDNLAQLRLELFDYVNWYNNIRPHGTLGYLTPNEAKALVSK